MCRINLKQSHAEVNVRPCGVTFLHTAPFIYISYKPISQCISSAVCLANNKVQVTPPQVPENVYCVAI